MKQKLSLIKKYFMYFNERFPIVGALLYAGALFFMSYFSASLFLDHLPIKAIDSIVGFGVVFLSLLHLRIFDEHKDYEQDKIAHPDRMLSKGLITLNDLRKLLYGVLLLEAALSLYLGTHIFMIWILIMFWSYLMYTEFFVPEFLNKQMGLYLISHQIIVPIILIFGLAQRVPMESLSIQDFRLLIILCVASMCSTITYEIARKTWSKEKEHECADSYTKSWGIKKTIIINQITTLISCSCFIYIYSFANIAIVFHLIVFLFYLIFLTAEILFVFKPEKRNSKIVELTGILYLLGVFINSCIGFAII
ncbi:UbiA prenyltransferase [Candidatus Magnetomorum sp. HK-1]|nr:UbiA prenyltransferase [Candidatus Magnetomorum sp. HK-1]